ncbi:MAG TPA: VIT1/CCC1 transporter family protein [Acidimicrobiales bacterium]|jgi:VIT1/CCC1 family predicted Fe2+/Mn2+ transporter|nr:VIT1/CCC1 transporter family protein [Acidimicrobiales bacterium]
MASPPADEARPSTDDLVTEAAPGGTVPPPPPEPHHRNVQGGAARAAVFGVSDGLVSNVALILGMAGADPAPGVVRLAGLAGLIGGAVSMAAGEYISMKAQSELLERELEMERLELKRRPESERAELVQIYRSRGIDTDTAEELASELMRDPEVALQTHAREELGIDPGELGSPVAAAVSSFLAFATGALIPLLPWFFGTGTAAIIASVILGGVAALTVGSLLARFTGRSVLRSALRQLMWSAVPAAVTYAIGSAVGVGGVG